MNAFIDKEGVLVAWGHMIANNDDTKIEVQEGFNLQPGTAKFVNGVWMEHTPPVNWIAVNKVQQTALMTAANTATSGMADAFVHGLLDDQEVASYKAWAVYKLALSKVDLTQATPAWPELPQ